MEWLKVTLSVVDATDEHLLSFTQQPVRQDDIDEWFAASGGRPLKETLGEILSAGSSGLARALLNDEGRCICLWGVVPGLHGEGVVWLIASVEAEQHGRHIHRYWPKEIALMHMRHALLVAIAYGNNKLHLSWLEAIGFQPLRTDYIGPGRLPFITYMREMLCAVQ